MPMDLESAAPVITTYPPCMSIPDLFTRIPLDDYEINVGLSMCGGCSVRQQCEEIVQPTRSFFDGICAGRYYVNGVVRAGV